MSQETQNRHPLLEKSNLPTLYSWEDWKKAWDAAPSLEILHSLLHFGFELPDTSWEDSEKRLCFYLELADGHDDAAVFRTRGPSGIYSPTHNTTLGRCESDGGVLQKISEKAFQVLCREFFRGLNDREPYPLWVWRLGDAKIMDKIIWFFRPGNIIAPFMAPSFKNIDLDRDNNHAKAVRQFLSDLCKLAWNIDGFRRKLGGSGIATDDPCYERLQPLLVRIILELGDIRKLLKNDVQINFPTLLALKELAVEEKLYCDGDYHLPTSLEEAIARGSEAAQVLNVLLIRGRERKRWAKRRKLMQETEKAQEKLKKLGQV